MVDVVDVVVGSRWARWEFRRLTQELRHAGDGDPVGETEQGDFAENCGRRSPAVVKLRGD